MALRARRARRGLRRDDGQPRLDRRRRTGRSADVPLLPDLLGGTALCRVSRSSPRTGARSYNSEVGDSVYYGDCARGHGVFGGGGSCTLPLQVTTVIYRLHSNQPLGAQRNTLIRGVPATVYDEGRSIELYSGRLSIDIFSDSFAHAYAAALLLRPLNASGSPRRPLPAPVYCPGLYGRRNRRCERAMASLPGHACQQAAAQVAFTDSLRLAAAGTRARRDG